MERNRKSVESIPDVDANGTITGYASTFTREPDWVGDVVAKGAFSKCLERMEADGTVLPLLYNHDQSLDSFIGKVTDIREDDHGLLFTAEFDATQKAQRARELAMDGRLAKFSFAYVVRDQCEVVLEDGRKANELRELDIDEVSLVLMPCNPDTSVVEVKGTQSGDGATGDAAPAVATAYIELVPRVKGLDEQQLADFTQAIAEAAHNGLELGLKAGRRNSKADEDKIRQAIDLLMSVLGEQEDIEDGDEGEHEGGEGDATPEGREGELEKAVEYAKAIMNAMEVSA